MARPSTKVSFSSEFFKVYIPSFSSQQLGIPPAFLRNFNGNIPEDVILKDCVGKQWNGRIEKVEGGVVINNGWQSFASQHSLENGDFLVFKYNGNSVFDVKIFGRSGCMKEEALISDTDTIHVKEEMEIDTEQKTSSRDGRDCNQQKYSETTLKRTEKSGGSSRASRLYMRKVAVKREHKDSKVAGYIVPKNPYFVSPISISSESYMGISVKVLKSHGIKLNTDMEVHDQNGKKWPMKVSKRRDGRIAFDSTDWRDFFMKHNLKIGDKCVFEFILGKGKKIKEMNVQIVRAGPAT